MRRIGLRFCRLAGDKRWASIRLTSGLFFLASALTQAGFKVEAGPLDLQPTKPDTAGDEDLLGFTLYEDLFGEQQAYFRDLRPRFAGLIAAGGPLVTLSPLAALYHLPEVDLFLRGEAEEEFPRLLSALSRGDATELLRCSGFFLQRGGLIAMVGFDRVLRVEDFQRLLLPLDFLRREHLECGMEINFSRGCDRGCLFCSRVQGGKLRRIPLEKAERLLSDYREKLLEFGLTDVDARALNINDDDILQDTEYARRLFALIQSQGFSLWGVQTSLLSLVELTGRGRVRAELLDLLADTGLYVRQKPLLWLGSDFFLPQRGPRLGKPALAPDLLEALLAELEKREIANYHYWISSDGDTTWPELSAELQIICGFCRTFPRFGLLPHAPFVIPYPSTPLYRLWQRKGRTDQLRLKKWLPAPAPEFAYPLVAALETRFPNLNRLLRNEPVPGYERQGFFDFLKAGDFGGAFGALYYFLRQERLQADASAQSLWVQELREEEEKLGDFLGLLRGWR